jgi:GntR family transcriptional regulator, transcriptional repressor for pyruvate dehydrogenase complex
MIPVQKVPITDQVVDKIKTSIIEGAFEESKKLPSEQSLCESLNVSRSTLREAFRVLQTKGFVELKPGRGAFVCESIPKDTVDVRDWFRVNAPRLNDFIEVRQAIETLAIKIAAKLHTEAEYAHLEAINHEFVAAVATEDVPAMAHLDEAFHEAIVNMSHNSLLININNLVSKEFKKYRSISFGVRQNAQNALEPHRQILASLHSRDPKQAMQSIENHLTMARDDMESVISN